MTNEKFYELMGEVNEVYLKEISEAAPKSGKTSFLKWCALAACLCICIIGAITFFSDIPENFTGTDDVNISADPAPENTAVAGDDTHGSMFSAFQDADSEASYTPIPMISSYGNYTHVDMAVNNGGVCLSESLRDAIENYGDTARYRVLVELFSDGVQIYAGSSEAKAEMDRLADNGYTVAYESYNDGYSEQSYLTLHAEAEQLTDFSVSESYGYLIMLYDEFFGVSDSPEAYSGAANIVF